MPAWNVALTLVAAAASLILGLLAFRAGAQFGDAVKRRRQDPSLPAPDRKMLLRYGISAAVAFTVFTYASNGFGVLN
jgi:hypothetical protein